MTAAANPRPEREPTESAPRSGRTWPPDRARWEAFLAGYEWGISYGATQGHAEGYYEAMTVLDEAGAFLAAQRPSSVPSFAELQRIRARRTAPSLSPAQIRVQAARSWGREPNPGDLAQVEADAAAGRQRDHERATAARAAESAADSAANTAQQAIDEAVAEVADEDDWAWPA